MSASSMLFQSVWVSAAFLWRPVGGLRPYARTVQWFGAFTWSKSECREVRFLSSTPYAAQPFVAGDVPSIDGAPLI